MLDDLHARLQQSPWLRRFTAMMRILLAVGFIPPGLTKVLGHRFTALGVDNPVGYFFDAFFQAESLYAFVGIAQVTAAVLLLWPRTATMGAVFYFPIILTITIITQDFFQGTWVITSLMTLGCLWLLVWDYDRLKPLLPVRTPRALVPKGRPAMRVVLAWGGLGMGAYAVLAASGLGGLWQRIGPVGLAVALAGGLVFGALFVWHLRQMPPALGD